MPHIHYKFSSRLSYDTVVFDGLHITLNELKRQIMGREKLRAGDCDLQITNAQTKEEYTDSGSLIPKGSSVIVRRIPSSSSKTHNNERSEVQLHHAFGASRAMDDHSSTRALSFFSKMQMANLVDVDASEEDKIKVMINQSIYDPMNVNTKSSNALSANYTCYRCGNPGHHIRNCPSSGQDKNAEVPVRIKKSTGIPRSFMVEVDDPNIKGAKLTNCGRYAITAIDAEAYAIGKKEKPPFLPQEPESEDQDDPIPSELLCVICNELLADAVVIPCCGNSYCDECIRTALLESEYHICPTCDQSEVSPDTLIANKFLRQAVNNFKKEQGHNKSLKSRSATSQSQNLTPAPTPVPTPPPLPMQNQPQKPQQSSHSQQDSLLDHPKTANAPPQFQVSGVQPATTDPVSENDTAATSLQPLENQLEISENEIEGKTSSDSAGVTPSGKVSNKDPTDAPSQPIIPDNHAPVAEQPQTVSVGQENQHSCSAGPILVYPESSVSLESCSSSLDCLSGGKTESNTQQLSTIPSTSSPSSYSNTPPPLFPSPLFHTYLSAQRSQSTYPPGYPPATPIWTLPAPQGTPIPSLCSSTATTTSSIPRLIPQEWYKYQKKKKERSPQRASGYKHSNSHSKSSTAKASCSYSRSSSRSESCSRSRSRSRHHSPYSHQRDLHTRSRQPSSYTYGYKRLRSPTPSSSSSPRRARHSRSKSPSSRKDRHHSRHHSKKSSSSSSHSRKRGECSGREAARSEDGVSRNMCTSQANSLELDRECYLQWKEEYKEWYEKYFSSYHQFHQLPVPLLSLPPPPPPPQWVSTDRSRNRSQASLNSRYQPQGRCPTEMDGCSPSSESSSDGRSPPSHSSSESCSTPSQSCSDSSSSLSYKANDSRSPPSQSSSDSRSMPSEDGAQLIASPERHNEKSRYKQVMLTKSSTEIKLQGQSTDNKPLKKLEDLSPLKHEQKKKKKQPEDNGQETSPPHAENSRDDNRKDRRKLNSDPKACKHSTPVQNKDSEQTVPKQDQPERKFIESNSEGDECWKRGKDLDSRNGKRQHKAKPNKERDVMSREREETPGGSKTPESRSEKNRKRKDEDLVKNEREGSLSGEMQSSKHLKTAEEPVNSLSEFLKPLDKEKQKVEKKSEKKTWPLAAKDIWEEGMKLKPQMKISININLDGKRKEENTGKHEVTGKAQENINYTENREEEQRVNRGEVNEKESSRNQEDWSEDKLKQGEGETRLTWDKFTFRDDKGAIAGEEEDTRQRKDDEDKGELDLWHCALTGVEESETGKGEEESIRDDDKDQEMREQKEQENREAWTEELMEGVKMTTKEDNTLRFSSSRSTNEGHQDGPNTKLGDGSSTSVVGSREEESLQRRTVVKTLEKYTQERWKELVHIQVPRSTWETEDEQDEGKARVHTDRVSVTLPQPSVTNKAEGDEEQRGERRREKERDSACSWSHRSVAPSSGKDRAERTTSADACREMRRERERQQERKRSKEQTREEGSRRDGDRERKRIASLPTSSQFYSSSTSHDAERTEWRHGGSQGSNKSSSCPSRKFTSVRNRESSMISREPDLPEENAQKTQRDPSLNLRYKDKDYSHYHSNHQDSSGSNRSKDRAPGTHHSESPGKGLLPFESPGHSQRESPHLGLMQSKSLKEEWKPNKAEKLVKERRENQGMMAVQGGGARWEDEADDKVDGGEDDWLGGGRDLEEGEMLSSQSSSVGSSASQGNSKDDKRREKERKQKRQKKREEAGNPGAAGGWRAEETQTQEVQEKQSGHGGGEWRRGGRQVETKGKPLSPAWMCHLDSKNKVKFT